LDACLLVVGGCLLIAVASGKNKKVRVYLVTAVLLQTKVAPICVFRIRCWGLRFWECTPIRFRVAGDAEVEKVFWFEGVCMKFCAPRCKYVWPHGQIPRSSLHGLSSFTRVIYINSCLDSSTWAILVYELCQYTKMESLPQILQLTCFHRYNDRAYELRQFCIVHSLFCSSIFTTSSNECTQPPFNSQ